MRFKTRDHKRSKNVAGLKNTKILFVSQVLQCIKWTEHNCIYKVVHGILVLSATCFGLYIGHHQVSIKLIERLYNLYGVLWGEGGGTRSRFTIVGSMKIRTWDGVTNI
jgi:hypothetical protein